jgi:callose synthase
MCLMCCFPLLELEASAGSVDTRFELSPEARGQADLKFTYVVTCQIYGKQKGEGKQEAADIALLMQRCSSFYLFFLEGIRGIQ